MNVEMYNFDTKSYDRMDHTPTTVDGWIPYISDIPAARNLFRLLVEYKKKPVNEAAVEVLSRVAGIHKEE